MSVRFLGETGLDGGGQVFRGASGLGLNIDNQISVGIRPFFNFATKFKPKLDAASSLL